MATDYDRKDVFTYIEAWEKSLATRKALYNRFIAGSLSGIILIVVTIGFSLEKIPQLGWFGKGLLSISLVLLVLSLGNILNCWRFVIDADIFLQDWKRRLVLDQILKVSEKDVKDNDSALKEARDKAHRYYPNSYITFMLAVLLGILGFFWIIWKF